MMMTVIGSRWKGLLMFLSGFASTVLWLILGMLSIAMYSHAASAFLLLLFLNSYTIHMLIPSPFSRLGNYLNKVFFTSFSDVVSSMQICGEHRESGILKRGFFASPSTKDAELNGSELEGNGKSKGGCT